MRRLGAAVVVSCLSAVVAFVIHARYFEGAPPMAAPDATTGRPLPPPREDNSAAQAKAQPRRPYVAVLNSGSGAVFEERREPLAPDLLTNLLPEERELLDSEPSGSVATLVARCEDEFLRADPANSHLKHERYRRALNLAAKLSSPVGPPPQSTIDKQRRYLQEQAASRPGDDDARKRSIIDQ